LAARGASLAVNLSPVTNPDYQNPDQLVLDLGHAMMQWRG